MKISAYLNIAYKASSLVDPIRKQIIRLTILIIFSREVTITDVNNIEKKLRQAMDMILVKKKRIAIAKKQMANNSIDTVKQSIWGMLASATSRKQESRHLIMNL